MRDQPNHSIRRGLRGVIAAAATCIAAAGGCVRSSPPVDTRLVIPRPTTTSVLVRNHHGADLRVWVVGEDGASRRLGIVPRFGSATMTLSGQVRLPARVMFVVIPLSGDEPQTSSPVDVEIGAKLVYTVAHDGAMSTLARLP